MAKKTSSEEIHVYATRAMQRLDSKFTRMSTSFRGDQRDVVRDQLKEVIGGLVGKPLAKNPEDQRVHKKIKDLAEQTTQKIQHLLRNQQLTGIILHTVKEEVERAIALRILGKGRMPEDIARLKKFEHEFDLETLGKVLEPTEGKRQLASGVIGQLITAKITTHKDLKNFIKRVLKCTDAQGVFSVEQFEKLEPYPSGAMGIDTLNLLLRYLGAKKLLKPTEGKKITGIKQADIKPDATEMDEEF